MTRVNLKDSVKGGWGAIGGAIGGAVAVGYVQWGIRGVIIGIIVGIIVGSLLNATKPNPQNEEALRRSRGER